MREWEKEKKIDGKNDKEEKLPDGTYYYLIEFKTEFFVTKEDKSIYKSFFNKEDAIDYCLDKINTESNQVEIFQIIMIQNKRNKKT